MQIQNVWIKSRIVKHMIILILPVLNAKMVIILLKKIGKIVIIILIKTNILLWIMDYLIILVIQIFQIAMNVKIKVIVVQNVKAIIIF